MRAAKRFVHEALTSGSEVLEFNQNQQNDCEIVLRSFAQVRGRWRAAPTLPEFD